MCVCVCVRACVCACVCVCMCKCLCLYLYLFDIVVGCREVGTPMHNTFDQHKYIQPNEKVEYGRNDADESKGPGVRRSLHGRHCGGIYGDSVSHSGNLCDMTHSSV